MSALQDLIATLESVNRDAERYAAELAGQAQRLSTAAARAAAVTRQTSRPEGGQAAAALQAAHRALNQAARHLQQASIAGRSYVARHAGSANGQRASPAAPTPAAAKGARYIEPGEHVADRFQQLVGIFGPDNPAGWIDAGNPHYSSGLECWTNNCGPCSRSFADTFQGKSALPALGDTQDPPGEYDEMWDALGVRPTSSMSNKHAHPAAFRESAFQALEASLQREGPGAVAIIGVDWDVPGLPRGEAGGHWFNAYVDQDGTVKWADEQIGQTAGWPPAYKTEIWRIEAVVRSDAGSDWKGLVL